MAQAYGSPGPTIRNVRSCRHSCRWRPLLLLAMLAHGAVGAVPAFSAGQMREVLATGRTVTGGRIGEMRAFVHGIDPTGAVIVSGYLDDDSAITLRIGDEQEVVWRQGGSPWILILERTVVSGNGSVLASRASAVDGLPTAETVVLVANGTVIPLLREGDEIPGGYTIGQTWLSAVNDAGTVVMYAHLLREGSSELTPAILRVRAGEVRILVGPGAELPAGRAFWSFGAVGITPDGRVLFVGQREPFASGIYAIDDEGVTVLAEDGDIGPHGGPLWLRDLVASDDDGNVLFQASQEPRGQSPQDESSWALYRTGREGIRAVVGRDDLPARKGRLSSALARDAHDADRRGDAVGERSARGGDPRTR